MERFLRNLWVVMASLGLAPACGGKAAQSAPSSEVPHASGGSATTAGTGGAPAAGAATAGASTTGGSSLGGSTSTGGGDAPMDGGAAGAPSEPEVPEVPHPYRALQVVAGAFHSCALLEDHRVKCWGWNSMGELGLEDMEPRGVAPNTMGDALPFVNLGTGRTAKQLAAGRYGTCAVLDDDSIKCWGTGRFHNGAVVGGYPGQMGDNLPPERLPPGRKGKAVSVGWGVSCAILDDDSLFCADRAIALPDNCRPARLYGNLAALLLCEDASLWEVELGSPPLTLLASNVTHAASVDYHKCYRQQDGTFRFGDLTFIPSSLPEPRDMAIAESAHVCVVDAAGAVDCWQRYEGAVPWAPPGTSQHIAVPLEEPAVSVTGGRAHHCALMESESVVCWNWAEWENDAVGAPTLSEPKLPPVDLGTYYPR